MRFARAMAALMKRDLQEKLSYRAAFLLDGVTMAGHALVFFFVAKLVPGALVPALAPYGGQYFPFALVGIAFANYHSAALNGLSAALSRELEGGTLELIWMSPAGLEGVLAAGWVWEFVWATARVLCYLGIGLAAYGPGLLRANFLAAAAVLAAMLAALTGLGLASAAFLLAFKRGDPVSLLINGATRLLSGVYFPVALLPFWLRPVSLALPFTFALEALRKSLLEGAGLGSVSRELAVLAVWFAVGVPAGAWLFQRAVDRARRDGSLALR